MMTCVTGGSSAAHVLFTWISAFEILQPKCCLFRGQYDNNQNIRNMNFKTFNLIDKINATGLDNTKWNIYMHLDETDTKEFYGTRESYMLHPGCWISVVEEKNSDFPFRDLCKPDHVVDIDERYVILFYEVDQPKCAQAFSWAYYVKPI